jgi:release factor glutamine methyltransferase
MMTINLREWLRTAHLELESLSDAPDLEAQILAGHILNKSRPWVIIHGEAVLDLSQEKQLDEALARLANGEPLAYITGHQEFYRLDFLITPALLVPRPETELLVEAALGWLNSNPNRRSALDVGTGSGCIAISIAKSIPRLTVTASDLSFTALRVALANAEHHNLSNRVHIVQSDLLQPFSAKFDLICANLPYIPSNTLGKLAVSRFEPWSALDGGPDGMQLIKRLLKQSEHLLAPGGLVLLEIEAEQGETALDLAKRSFPTARIQIRTDLADNPRLLMIQA